MSSSRNIQDVFMGFIFGTVIFFTANAVRRIGRRPPAGHESWGPRFKLRTEILCLLNSNPVK